LNSTQYNYPQSPVNVSEDLVKPSPEFRKQVIKVMNNIVLFIIVYILLIAGALALMVATVYFAVWLLSVWTSFWSIIISIGMMGFALMVVVFLIKFVFKSNTVDRSDMTEITARQYPELFDFLKRVASDTKTRVPKRVYLSNDVSASVFYDSSFWSMFFPIRKNLNIGLGLVNCVNVSEFKAIVAHEFGHFSQRSMKLGSYVYNVNHIIHDMLHDNADYEETLNTFGNISNTFGAFAMITTSVADIIRDILRVMYERINLRFMALSRQMEFHADAVAATVSGSVPLAASLYRLSYASDCYTHVLQCYQAWAPENKKALNIYADHELMMKRSAVKQGHVIDHGVVQITLQAFTAASLNRVVINQQWSSHPGIVERATQLGQLNVDAAQVKDPAWTLFRNAEDLQRQMTDNIYVNANLVSNDQTQVLDSQGFLQTYESLVEKYNFHPAYQGFYDARELTAFEPRKVVEVNTTAMALSDIITQRTITLHRFIQAMGSDIELLAYVAPRKNNVKTFDFEGKNYERQEAAKFISQLKQEQKAAAAELQQADIELFRLYYKKCVEAGKGYEAIDRYEAMMMATSASDKTLKELGEMLKDAASLFNQTLLTGGFVHLKTSSMVRDGAPYKLKIKKMLEEEGNATDYTSVEKETLQAFCDDMRPYYVSNVRLDTEAVKLYMKALQLYARIISDRALQVKKETLEHQARLLQGAAVAA
jgi:Zn-dependent protease with chaperone function